MQSNCTPLVYKLETMLVSYFCSCKYALRFHLECTQHIIECAIAGRLCHDIKNIPIGPTLCLGGLYVFCIHLFRFVNRLQCNQMHEKNAAQAAVASATAALSSARLDQVRTHADASGISKLRAQTRLLSPVDGIVAERLAEPGVTVVAGQTLLQVIDPASVWVKTRIEQKQAGLVRVGQPADIVLRSQPNTVLQGKVKRVEQIGDAITEERIVNVIFADKAVVKMVGELAEVTIKLPQLDQALSIPAAALKQKDKQEGVWAIQDGRVQFKPVRTGLSTLEGRAQIVSGLAEGEEVIVYSQQELYAGMKVKVVAATVKAKP